MSDSTDDQTPSDQHADVEPGPLGPGASARAALNGWLRKVLGRRGYLLLGFLILIGGVWILLGCPGGQDLLYKVMHPVPKLKSDRFVVVIAEFENDAKNAVRQQLSIELASLKRFEGIEFLSLPMMISLSGPRPRERIDEGHVLARRYLVEYPGAVLIWGNVTPDRNLQLFWTTPLTSVSYRGLYQQEQSGALPPLFVADLKRVLTTFILSRYAAAYRGGQLDVGETARIVRPLEELLELRPELRADTLAALERILADGLLELGYQSGDSATMLKAVRTYRLALADHSDKHTEEWAQAQNNLGNALYALGVDHFNNELIKDAIGAYKEALKVRQQERLPDRWAATMSNIGYALSTLGLITGDADHLEKALRVYQQVLDGVPGGGDPVALVLRNSGYCNAHVSLGLLQLDADRVRGAISTILANLQATTQKTHPGYWAMTQSHLGRAHSVLGYIEDDALEYDRAIVAFRAALSVYSRKRSPRGWANAQVDLGTALLGRSRLDGGAKYLEEAVSAFKKALSVKGFGRGTGPRSWATAQRSLGDAQLQLFERGGASTRLEAAIEAYEEALKEITRERFPMEWRQLKVRIGEALLTLDGYDSFMETRRLERAIAVLEEARPAQGQRGLAKKITGTLQDATRRLKVKRNGGLTSSKLLR